MALASLHDVSDLQAPALEETLIITPFFFIQYVILLLIMQMHGGFMQVRRVMVEVH